MQTISIGIQNLLAPCRCACKYCLLQSCKKAVDGIDYNRGKKFAERFVRWAKEKGLPELPYYFIGYCAEYPQLFDNIAFNGSVGFTGANYMQCNGIRIRNEAETDEFTGRLKTAGIAMIDTTFFGNEEYHDRFAARAGDYEFMLRLAKSAVRRGITSSPSVVVTEENAAMLDGLIDTLAQITDLHNIHAFLPDYRGRGNLMEDTRLTKESYETLSEKVKSRINFSRYKTESEWLSMRTLPEYTKRAIVVTLRKDNIEQFEQMSCGEIVKYVEDLDDAYYRAIAPVNQLSKLYGDPNNTKLYRLRDLFWMWQKRYIKENHLSLYDVTDERFCNTVRS